MPNEVLVDIRGVRKKYCRSLKSSMKYGVLDIAGDLLGREVSPGLRKEEFYATDDISLSVERGECLGLIGGNGAGKSTLLKMVNGIFPPDEGSIEVTGRVGALIEVGAGFHPLLSGRENIYISGAIQGMSKANIDRKLDSIIDFAELNDFIDMPIKNYSSGMYVRLGFSVAVHLEPDVLIIDEVLAVGDMSFRNKCYQEIDKLRQQCAILFVSHNMQQVNRICDRACFLERGRVIYEGDPVEAIAGLNRHMADAEERNREQLGGGEVHIVDISFATEGKNGTALTHGDNVEVEVILEAKKSYPDAVINLTFTGVDEVHAMQCTNQRTLPISVPAGRSVFRASIPDFPLVPGVYHVTLLVQSPDMLVPYAWDKNITSIVVEGRVSGSAAVRMPTVWRRA